MTGRLVVLEGLDGSGTTTQVAEVAARLRAAGRDVHATREPSDGPIGRLIREALAQGLRLPSGGPPTAPTMALLFAADRVDHLAREVEPALARGALVLSDRYLLSSLAYQGEDDELAWVTTLNGRARQPDLTILLDVEPEVAATRRAHAGRPDELYDRLETQRRVAIAYRTLARRPSLAGPVEVLDGAQAPEQVTAQVIALIEALP